MTTLTYIYMEPGYRTRLPKWLPWRAYTLATDLLTGVKDRQEAAYFSENILSFF